MSTSFLKVGLSTVCTHPALACAVVLALSQVATAYPLKGSTPDPSGTSVFPPDVSGDPAGTLVAKNPDTHWSFTTTAGTTSGTLDTAVYLESSGTLDFYFQVTNDASSVSSIARVSMVTFSPFSTNVGFRTDGASLPGGVFVDGTCSPTAHCPNTADRDGSVVGFNFGPTPAGKIAPGQTSVVFVISTNAMHWKEGNVEFLDGGDITLKGGFQPTSGVPETTTMALLGGGLLGLMGIRRYRC